MIGEIIVAVIALVGTIAGTLIANRKTTALISYRLDILEKKQDKHNQVIERTYELEKDVAVIKEVLQNEQRYTN